MIPSTVMTTLVCKLLEQDSIWSQKLFNKCRLKFIFKLTKMDSVFTELEFHTKIYPIRISIFERSVPGTVVRVWAWDELTNYWQKLWSGPPQSDGQDPRIFTPPLAICKFKTNIIRLELNYSLAAYKTLLVGAFLLGTKDLFLPKDDIKDHRLINVIPTRDDDAECTFPEEKRDKLNLTRHVYNAKSFYSDLNNIKRIIRQNYVIWYVKR